MYVLLGRPVRVCRPVTLDLFRGRPSVVVESAQSTLSKIKFTGLCKGDEGGVSV